MTAMARRRFLAMAAALALVPARARAEEGGTGEVYVKLPTIVVEYWDADGLFHPVNMELTAVFPSQTSVNKKISDRIARVLSAMTWEDFSRGNPAATVKAVALDVLRKDPSGEKVTEVLIQKLMMR